jgi:hypothetical protein
MIFRDIKTTFLFFHSIGFLYSSSNSKIIIYINTKTKYGNFGRPEIVNITVPPI